MRLRPLFFAALAALALPAQDPGLKETLALGKTLWAQQGDREGATARFEQVLAALGAQSGQLTPEWLKVLCEAHAWMAILEDRVPARRPQATKHLEQMIELDPGFDIDRTVTNARLQAVFDGLRTSRLAKVALTLAPEGGRLEVNGQEAPPTPGLRWLKPGPHTFTYRRPGFRPTTVALELPAKEAKALTLTLERSSSTVSVTCAPANVSLTLDGQPLGATRPGVGPEAQADAERLGVTPDQVSAPFVVEGIGPREHILEISAPCHRTRRLRIPPEMGQPLADHQLEPVKLERSEGRLSITASAPGGVASLSGRQLGPLPVKDALICAGPYELRVDFPSGAFTQSLEVPDGGQVAVTARPKPRLAFIGLIGAEEFAGRERLVAQFSRLGALLKEVAFLPSAKPEETPADAMARLRLSKGAELLCYLVPTKDGPVRQVDAVLTTLGGEEVRWRVNPLDQEPLAALVERLNTQPVRMVKGLGVSVLDLPGQPGPWVLEASEAATAAGLRLQLPITQAAGQPLPSVAAFRKATEAAGNTLSVAQDGKEISLPVSLRAVELPLHSDDLAYPLLLADLQLRRQGATGDEAGLLAFHQAQVLMHFRRFDRALETLREVALTTTEGVSQGTVAYYEGLCLLRLGQAFLPDARTAFTKAASFPKATLFGPDGPLVAPLARQILDDIKP